MQVLGRGEITLRDGLASFADLTAHLEPSPATHSSAAQLWRPRDAESLLGITDLYEVSGRFSFQGDDDANLRAFADCVIAARADLTRQRSHLEGLVAAPVRICAVADAMESAELESSRAEEAELLRQFEPEAGQLRDLCKRLLEAVRATRRPDLARLDSADALYVEYVGRVGGLYGKALPVLREAIAALSKVARCEVPPSWPDALPFAAHLSDDLLTSPLPETPAVLQLRQALESFGPQEGALRRAQDELGVQARRIEGEAAATKNRDEDLLREVEIARQVLRWSTRIDAVEAAQAALAAIQVQGQARTQELLALQARGQQTQAEIAATKIDGTEWAQAIQAKEGVVAKHRGEEPSLFGKDEWRRRLAELEAEANELRDELKQRQQRIVEANFDVGRLRAREATEHATIAALSQQLEEARRREAQAIKEVQEMEKGLGANLPPRRLPTAYAEELLANTATSRNEIHARLERTTAELRRVAEDADRAEVQLKQLATERTRMESGLAVALRLSSAAQEEVLRALAVRRQAAFESHAAQVMAVLEESLVQVDRNFIEPARRAMLVRAGMLSDAPQSLRARGGALEVALPALQERWAAVVEPVWGALERVEGGFLRSIGAWARAAWREASA